MSNRMAKLVLVTGLVTGLLMILLSMHGLEQAKGATTHWHRVGTSTYGGSCEPYEVIGNRGADLAGLHGPALWRSFAELDMGYAMGHLPNGARIRVLNPATHRRMTLTRRDIGRGGQAIHGVRRGLDLWWKAARYLAGRAWSCSSWTGVTLWRRIG